MQEEKGILAFGCSFTWGEGLYYYSGLPNLPLKEYHEFNYNEMTEEMIEFKNKVRYLNLVSEELGIPYEYAFDHSNGGSTIGGFSAHNFEIMRKDYSKIKYIIWQTSSATREWSCYPCMFDWQDELFHFKDSESYWWYYEQELNRQLLFMKKRITEFENAGCKVIVFNWNKEYTENEYYKKHFSKYHLPLEFDGIIYESFDQVIDNDELAEKYTIAGDFAYKNLQKNDSHFNLKGQRVLADNIIKRIKQLENE